MDKIVIMLMDLVVDMDMDKKGITQIVQGNRLVL